MSCDGAASVRAKARRAFLGGIEMPLAGDAADHDVLTA